MSKKSGLKRMITNKYDQFYTKEVISNLCMTELKSKINISEFDIVIEPSAGTGNFIKSFKKNFSNYAGNKILAYDIDPKLDNIKEQDFLTLNIDNLKGKKVLVFGNPPFGRQSSMAKKFIKTSCKFATIIAFILSKSFKKQSMNRAFDLNFHLIHQIDLPTNSFILDGKGHDVPCIFQIWKKKPDKRKLINTKYMPNNYTFVKQGCEADFAFRRVGVYAGKTMKNTDVSKQSHYFIKLTTTVNLELEKMTDLIKEINDIEWKHDNTAGCNSISKYELQVIDNIIKKYV